MGFKLRSKKQRLKTYILSIFSRFQTTNSNILKSFRYIR